MTDAQIQHTPWQPTPGPWHWVMNSATKQLELESAANMRTTVFRAVRWGMQSATIAFNQGHVMVPAIEFGKPIPGREHHKNWALQIDHPDARLIAAAPELYALLNEILTEWEQDWQDEEPRQLSDLESAVQEVMTRINPNRYYVAPDSEKPDYSQPSF